VGSVIAGYLMSLDQRKAFNKMKQTNEKEQKPLTVSDDESGEEIIKTSGIYLNQDLNDKQSVLEFIANVAVKDGIAEDKIAVLEGLNKREEQSSTGMEK